MSVNFFEGGEDNDPLTSMKSLFLMNKYLLTYVKSKKLSCLLVTNVDKQKHLCAH